MTDLLLASAERAYAERDWSTTALQDGQGFLIEVRGEAGDWTAVAITDDGDLTFAFYSVCPIDVPAERRTRVSEFVDRANLGLVSGTFELDHDTGEVRLRTAVDLAGWPRHVVEDPAFLDVVVIDLSSMNIGIFDHYFSALAAAIIGDVPVADILAEIAPASASTGS